MSRRRFWFAILAATLAGSAARPGPAAVPVVDGHNHEGLAVVEGRVDTSRLRGLRTRGIDVAVIALPVDRSRPADLETRVRDEITQLRRAAASGAGLVLAGDPAALLGGAPEAGTALLFSIEWFHGIFAGDVAAVRRLADFGVRSIGLAEKDVDGLFGTGERAASLTPFGTQVVAAMNDAGVLVDVTHLSHAQKLEVIRRSRAPVVASHSLVQAVTPDDFNLPDEVVNALASTGGSVWVSFNRGDLLAGAPDEEALDRLIAHIEVLIKRLGPGRIGIGTDLQKGGQYVASPLNRDDAFAQVCTRLLALGHSQQEVDGILGGNVLRALSTGSAARRDQ